MKQKTCRVTLVNWVWNLFPGELADVAPRRPGATRRRVARARRVQPHHQQNKMLTKKPMFLKSIPGLNKKTYRVTLVNWVWNLLPGELAGRPSGHLSVRPSGRLMVAELAVLYTEPDWEKILIAPS